MPGLNHWLSVARAPDADDVREHILSGYKDGKPFTPYVLTFALPVPVDRVLDFGCGLGRNLSYLKTIARHITGFDLPPMIERYRTMAGGGADVLSDDWNGLRENRFDLIFAALVLQHIETEACRSYLMDFLRMAPAVYLLTRADNDFGENVFDIIAQTDMFEAGDCVEVDHDPDTSQLRVLGCSPFDACRQAKNGHFEVLLHSTVFHASRKLDHSQE